jgi:hypothetical protein
MKDHVLLYLVLMLLAGLSCTEERTIIQPVESESVRLQGTLYGWFCGVGDLVNNPPTKNQRLFGSYAGESAEITLIRDNGFTTWFDTDDSSSFFRYVSAGSYKIIIETGYSWPPDTVLNVHLTPGDTLLELDIVYDVTEPDTVAFYFFYPTIDDTVGIIAEFQTIFTLSNSVMPTTLPNPLPIWWNMPMGQFAAYRSYWQPSYSDYYYVVYHIPVVRECQYYLKGWNVLQAWEELHEVLEADTTGAYANVSVSPLGTYPCMD